MSSCPLSESLTRHFQHFLKRGDSTSQSGFRAWNSVQRSSSTLVAAKLKPSFNIASTPCPTVGGHRQSFHLDCIDRPPDCHPMSAEVDPPVANGHTSRDATSNEIQQAPPPPHIEATLAQISSYRNVRGVMILSRTQVQSAAVSEQAGGHIGGVVHSTGSVFDGEGGRRYARTVETLVGNVSRAVGDCEEGVSKSIAHWGAIPLCLDDRLTYPLLGRAEVHAHTDKAPRAAHHARSVSCDATSRLTDS
jgi:dynein light chain roadblock-type